jgi:predicted transposase/invertase (TIGR01784 family)
MSRSLVSFDWAIKRLLRNKANFEVLEGFLSELLYRKIRIKQIIESEGNKVTGTAKTNKVDILVEADGQEIVIIELQYDSEYDYFQRMLFGVSKVISEHIDQGDEYAEVKKVYSINIVYFDLGQGSDYIYHGKTDFKGIHTNDILRLSKSQQNLYRDKTEVSDIYPEYYIIKVNSFDDVAKNTLDEWIYYLKHSEIKDNFTAQGMDKAREILEYDKLSDAEKQIYNHLIEDKRVAKSTIHTALFEGKVEGLAEGEVIGRKKGEAIGREKGRKESETATVLNAYQNNFSIEQIQTITNLDKEEILNILKQHDK